MGAAQLRKTSSLFHIQHGQEETTRQLLSGFGRLLLTTPRIRDALRSDVESFQQLTERFSAC